MFGLQKSRPWNVTVVICDNLFLFHYVCVCGASLLWCLCTLLRGEHSSLKQGRTKTPFSLGFCAAEVHVALTRSTLVCLFSFGFAICCSCRQLSFRSCQIAAAAVWCFGMTNIKDFHELLCCFNCQKGSRKPWHLFRAERLRIITTGKG